MIANRYRLKNVVAISHNRLTFDHKFFRDVSAPTEAGVFTPNSKELRPTKAGVELRPTEAGVSPLIVRS